MVNNVSSANSYMANSKLFLTDNNYQSYQFFSNKNDNYWLKIGKIGNLRSLLSLAKNYCQFSIGDAFIFIEICRRPTDHREVTHVKSSSPR